MRKTLQEAIASATETLAGISDNPRLDAELLLAHAMDKDRSYFYTWPEKPLEPEIAATFDSLVARRVSGKPLAYILGSREFWSMQLRVTPDTLIPRAETELLIELALEQIPDDKPLRILDLGTGSGAIALAIASERPMTNIYAVDASEPALEIAQDNATSHGLKNIHFLHSDWYTALQDEAAFDLILSNPPYIREDDPHLERGDLPSEPRSALASGIDGLEDIRRILEQLDRFLMPGGWLLIEHGYDQGQAVQQLFLDAGLDEVFCHKDLNAQDRVCIGHRPV
jgi:release factor glutamine methyltransferase